MASHQKVLINPMSLECDGYHILQKIGSGSYGEVYKAKHVLTDKLVAFKVIESEEENDYLLIEQEIAVLKECIHPNIIAYYKSYLQNNRYWICMEYCAGGSLQDVCQTIGAFSEIQIAFVCREILSGLAYLHSKGKIHRDIKGANILLTDTGDIKLTDFGVSTQITATIKKTKSFIGTPYWMAPEVAAVDRKGGYNQLCDIWACGITAIELAETQPPMFDLHPMRALLLMSKSGFKPPALRDRKKWSPNFHSFIKMALTKNPKKRPAAEKLLQHEFFQGDLSNRIGLELFQKVSNPSFDFNDSEVDEDGAISNVLQRISSRNTSDPDSKLDKDGELVHKDLVGVSDNSDCTLNQDSGLSLTEVQDLWKFSLTNTTATLYNSRDDAQAVDPSFKTYSDQNDERPCDQLYTQNTTLPLRDSSDCEVDPSSYNNISDQNEEAKNKEDNGVESEPPSDTPPVPRRRVKRRKPKSKILYVRGLPPTPKVLMGACFSKVFNSCPLRINCMASWVHPETKDQHLLIAAEEGIYTLNLNELHETAIDQLYPRRTIWMHVKKDVLMTLSGNTPQLYRHNLRAMQNKQTHRFSLNVNKIPERLVPRKFAITTKVPDTKGCTKCCVARKPFDGYEYLCGATPGGIFLMQWYEPLNKFMLLKHFEYILPSPLNVFEMITAYEWEYPMVCVSVKRSCHQNKLILDYINMNSKVSWFHSSELELDGSATIIPKRENLSVIKVMQIKNDVILVCYDNVVKFVTLEGKLIENEHQLAELQFQFPIESVIYLPDSILAFHKHGMQGKSLFSGNVHKKSPMKIELIGY